MDDKIVMAGKNHSDLTPNMPFRNLKKHDKTNILFAQNQEYVEFLLLVTEKRDIKM